MYFLPWVNFAKTKTVVDENTNYRYCDTAVTIDDNMFFYFLIFSGLVSRRKSQKQLNV
jgi:hypothetical protein